MLGTSARLHKNFDERIYLHTDEVTLTFTRKFFFIVLSVPSLFVLETALLWHLLTELALLLYWDSFRYYTHC